MANKATDLISKPAYGIVDSGVFGLRIISGIITGVRYTETTPVYTIEFGKNMWTTSQIAQSKEELVELFKLPTLERISESHGLMTKYDFKPHGK